MKICYLNKHLKEKGGEGRYAYDLIRHILKLGNIGVVMLTQKESGHNLEKAILHRADRLRYLPNIFINAIKIRKYIKDCDIIHALDGYPYGVIAALANIGLNKKLIISGIGTFSVLPLGVPIKRTLLKWAYRKADKIFCISRFTEKQILKRVNGLKNTVVMNHGVDYEKYARFANSFPKKENDEEKIVLTVGVLKWRKGYHISIPAIAEVKKKYKNIKYYIVGREPAEIYLELVKKFGLEENVKFFKFISDEELVRLYYEADIFLMTSINTGDTDFEGFGLVYLEAGACGKPVIGTHDCGAEDAIVDGVTGLLVPQNNIQATAGAILKLLDNPELAEKLGENGKKRAQQMNWDNVVKKYIEYYKSL
jgi:phosphatidylinositol alpha-1,6-mannosyltransferase